MVNESASIETFPGVAEQMVRLQPEPTIERTTLLAWLEEQRLHALGILDGLDEEALRRPVLPSGWSCLGMIQHLAALERFWFQAVVAGEPGVIAGSSNDDDEWRVSTEVTVATVFDAYRQESERSTAIIRTVSLDAAPAWWPEGLFGEWRLHTVREIILHVMTETANHAGHLDVVRETIDGRQWLVLDQ